MISKKSEGKNQKGFTIIELLIASTVFSAILLMCAAGIISIGKLFYKGITSGTTQEIARSAIDVIKDDFEFSGGYFVELIDPVTHLPLQNNGSQGFCIGSHLYSYKLGQKIASDGTGHALVVREYPGCDITPGVTPDDICPTCSSPAWHELLGSSMRLGEFTATIPLPPASQVKPLALSISINVLAGDDDLINIPAGRCKGGLGSQFCASSPLSAYAVRRLR